MNRSAPRLDDYSAPPRYALVQRLLHWLIAGLVLLALITGGTIGYFGFEGLQEQFGQRFTGLVYTSHKTLGLMILGLMLIRVLARLYFGKPGYAQPLPRFHRVASQGVHGLLYLALLGQPVLGWLATGSGDFPVHLFHIELPGLMAHNDELSRLLFLWHRYVAYLLVGLIVIHIAGAIYHWIFRRDEVMQRMSLFRH